MTIIGTLKRRVAASKPCCIVCGKKLSADPDLAVPVIGKVGVLACPGPHAQLVGGGVALSQSLMQLVRAGLARRIYGGR